MRTLNDILGTIDSYIGSANWFVYFLLGSGIFITLFLKFHLLRFIRHAVRLVWGQYDKKPDGGDTSYLQPCSTTLSGFRGNIACMAPANRSRRVFCAFLDGENSYRWGGKFASMTLWDLSVRKIRSAYSNEKSTNSECDSNILI